jgi:hypothetical protein
MAFKVGTAKYAAAKHSFKMKDGSQIYRILPPLGRLADEGIWSKFEAIHWGYKGNGGKFKPFRCPQVKQKKMVVVPCAECILRAQRKADYDNQYKNLVEAKKMSADAAKTQLKPLGDWLEAHNCDKKHYLNVINPAGEIGRLPIPYKSFQSLQKAIGELLKKKVDPLAPDQGVWFDFNRSGTFNETVHTVSVVMEDVQVGTETLQRIKKAPLTEAILKRLESEAWDLSDMFRSASPDDVARLVSSGGDADVVDSVFSSPEDPGRSTPGVGVSVGSFAEPDYGDEESVNPSEIPDLPGEEPATSTTTATPATAPVLEAAPEAPSEEDLAMAALQAQMDALKAKSKPAATKTETKPAASAKTMSNEDFLKNFGAGKV